ncbi:MAG: glycosyltransferase family 4 protein, partial [bacterium]|nr:glycosyltransferase family 4 protein [bacterium]
MTTDKNINEKNVWMFNHYAKTPDLFGGSRHYAISKILVSRGYNVTLFAAAYNPQKDEDLKCPQDKDYAIEVRDGVRFVWLKTFPYKKNNWRRVFNMVSYSRRCARVYKELLKENKIETPGTVMGSSVHLFAVYTGYSIAKKLKAKFVMEVRDLWPMTLVEFRKGLKYHPIVFFFGALEKFLAKRAKRIVSVLPKADMYYEKMGLQDKFRWIPNGVDTTLYQIEQKKSVEDENKKKFTVMYTGTFGMEANLSTLINAAKITQEKGLPINFEMVGRSKKKKELEELKDTYALKNLRFQDPVEKAKIPELLGTADAVWIGTRNVKNLYKYGFSFNKLFEYLSAAKPILFSIQCDYNPVEDAQAGITLPPGDPEALANAIIRLYEMPQQERKEIGE